VSQDPITVLPKKLLIDVLPALRATDARDT
jgi:hypothetical protein